MSTETFRSDHKRDKPISKEEVRQSTKEFLASGRKIKKADNSKIKMLVGGNWESKKKNVRRV